MGGTLNCRVCGYLWDEPPWGRDGDEPSYVICPCCNVEAGYEDHDAESTRGYRTEWLASGAPWSDPDEAGDGLTTEQRLSDVPPGFE